MIALHPLRESYIVFPLSTLIVIRPLHILKAELAILVTELGIMMEIRPIQRENACLPIFVTELGIVIEKSPLHPSNAALPIDSIVDGNETEFIS